MQGVRKECQAPLIKVWATLDIRGRLLLEMMWQKGAAVAYLQLGHSLEQVIPLRASLDDILLQPQRRRLHLLEGRQPFVLVATEHN